MNLLRRLPLSRLLLACALVLVLGAGATAFATSLISNPTPPPKPLANAVHDALAAPRVAGVSARIKFTNHLIEGAGLASQSSDGGPGKTSPLLSGASGRLWISATGKVRLELQSESGDTQVLYDGQTLSLYESSSNTLYRMQLPRETGDASATSTGSAATSTGSATTEPAPHKIPTVEAIQQAITRLMGHVTLSGATPSDVAGQPTYTVRISPSHDGGLVGGAELAWDALSGVPLRLALYATTSSAPVVELAATAVSYEAVPDSVFAITPPPGATIHDISAPQRPAGADGGGRGANSGKGTNSGKGDDSGHDHGQPALGATAVQATIPFKLDAPATLAGMPLSEVRSIELDGHPSALLTYGHGLAGLAVLENQTTSDESRRSSSDSSATAGLPSVSINGSTADELPTALGTLLHFERAGVSYTVAGSVTPATAEAAARGL